VWEAFESLPSQTRPQLGAKPAKRLTALAHELASDDILPGAGKLAHAEMHRRWMRSRRVSEREDRGQAQVGDDG
jgi:hypothetical protein